MKKVSIFAFVLVAAARFSVAADEAPKAFHGWSGSRTIPVHRIALSDENGEKIVPQYKQSMPFSARATCGACHDYNKISQGWHFNYAEKNVPGGRVGQPWIWHDEVTGVQLPVSGRGWDNTWTPEAAGLTPWTFIKAFGRNLPGGGLGETEDGPEDQAARWSLSGKLEVDCLACHSASPEQNHTEWVKQVARENFRWAATAAAGFGEVGGMASRMPSSWTVVQGPNQDDSQYAIAPFVNYNKQLFDRKNRVLIDLATKPQDRHCLFCHSVAQDGKEREDFDSDIHTRSGMNCVECHRNGVDHMTTRGYEKEARDRQDLSVAASSCRGCHLGVGDAKGALAKGGRLGSPRPDHKGIPPVHFEKLACTTCHSGPYISDKLVRVRTARANRIGIIGVADWTTDMPYIVEPVFMKGQDGKIAPHRVSWPSFWAKVEGDKIAVVAPEDVKKAGTNVLEASRSVSGLLGALNIGDPTNGVVVLAAAGKVYRSNVDNGLDLNCCKSAPEQAGLALLKAGALLPMVPSFDQAAEQMDPNIQVRITDLLKALTGHAGNDGVPVMMLGDKLYQLDDTGMMKTGELKAEVDLAKSQSDFMKLPSKSITWGLLKDRQVSPVIPDFVLRSVVETVGTGYTFTEEQVAMVLKTLTTGDQGGKSKFAYINAGKMFVLDQAGGLQVLDHKAAEPVAWPLAHEVRSKQQALGAKVSCTVCHSARSPFFFGKVEARGPMKTSRVQVKKMFELQDQGATFHRLFGLSFLVRSSFKIAILAAACLIGAVLVLYGLLALNSVTKFLGSREKK